MSTPERTSFRAPAMNTDVGSSEQSTPQEPRALRRAMKKLSPTVRAWVQRFRATLGDDERARFDAMVSSSRAQQLGSRIDPRLVVGDFLRLLDILSPWILRSGLAPYGPRRARYALELAQATLPPLDNAATPSRTVVTTPAADEALSPRGHRRALRTLSRLATPAAGPLAAEVAAQPGLSTLAARHTLTLARIAWVRDHVPEVTRDDVGLTGDVLAALASEAETALDTRDASLAESRARKVLRSDTAESCGRLIVEIRHLVAAARDNAADNGSIPAVSSRFAPARPSRTKTTATPVPPAPVPAPTP